MCQHCVDALQKNFPDLPEKDAVALLWEFTSFPFGSHEQVQQELVELAAQRPVQPAI